MYSFNTCHPKTHLVQGYPPVVPTAECGLCGERVRMTPIEVLTNRAEIDPGSYVCPLCRRLIAEAESDMMEGLDIGSRFPRSTAFSFGIRTMNEMEDQFDGRYEEESDTDEAADTEREGVGGMCPPSDEGPDSEEHSDDELPLEADLWLQIHVHLTIHRGRQVK